MPSPSPVLGTEWEEMAKKKPDSGIPKTLFAVKGTEEWFDWLKRYADFMATPAMGAIDSALRAEAKRQGFPEPMPKRMKKGAD